jgi:hypothetical protein
MRLVETPVEGTKAEGHCYGLPYNTELVNSNGVSVHFWTGDREEPFARQAAEAAERRIRQNRDVVYCTYSSGYPSGFWAHQDI